MIHKNTQFSFGRGGLLPQEEMLEIKTHKQSLSIGVLCETDPNELRTPLTPQGVDLLIQNGCTVLFERNAAAGSKFTNEDYAATGAIMCEDKLDVYKADVLIKVAPFNAAEIDLLREKQIIFSSFTISDLTKEQVQKLIDKKVIAIAYEYIRDSFGNYPVERSMSEIAGSMAIIIASDYLSNSEYGKGTLLAGVTGISPVEVVILGANTAGEYAARAALGFGAHVKMFDNYMQNLIQIQYSLGQRLFTSTYHPSALEKALKSADVVIGAIQLIDKEQQFYVSEEMIMNMKKGSVIVDLSIDQGGCFKTSRCTNHSNPVFVKHGIIHYCVPNITSRVARTATIAMSNIVAPTLLKIAESGSIASYLKHDFSVRQGVYIYNGILTNSFIAQHYNMPFTDMDLLMVAF